MPQIPSNDYCAVAGDEARTGAFWRDCFSELLATFLLVASNLFLVQETNLGHDMAHGLQIALGMTFVWAAVGYGLGDFGGAHTNNAVTFACLIRREITIVRAIVYWIMQAGGAIAAAFFIYAVSPELYRGDLGNTLPSDDVTQWQAVVLELFATSMVCYAYLASFSVDRKGYVVLSSLPVGMALGLGIFLTRQYSGASLNSMRSLGPAVVVSVMDGNSDYWPQHWIYWAGPMGGALLAGILYWIFDSADQVDRPNNDRSVSWSYGNDQPRRPQVKVPSVQDVRGPRSNGGVVVPRGVPSKELLNRPGTASGGDGVYVINGTATLTGDGGVSAYSQPRPTGCTTGFVNYN